MGEASNPIGAALAVMAALLLAVAIVAGPAGLLTHLLWDMFMVGWELI